jgi:hypothetical protein
VIDESDLLDLQSVKGQIQVIEESKFGEQQKLWATNDGRAEQCHCQQ